MFLSSSVFLLLFALKFNLVSGERKRERDKETGWHQGQLSRVFSAAAAKRQSAVSWGLSGMWSADWTLCCHDNAINDLQVIAKPPSSRYCTPVSSPWRYSYFSRRNAPRRVRNILHFIVWLPITLKKEINSNSMHFCTTNKISL